MCDHLSTGNAMMKAALFSGVVATFLALSIPDLRNHNGSLTPLLAVNILWLLSLVLSVGSAFSASKVQEWVEAFQSPKTHQTTGTQTTETRQITETHNQTTGSVRESPLYRPSKFLEIWLAFLDYISALLFVIVLEILRTSLAIAVFLLLRWSRRLRMEYPHHRWSFRSCLCLLFHLLSLYSNCHHQQQASHAS